MSIIQFHNNKVITCKRCSSLHLTKHGTRLYTGGIRYILYRCQTCGHYQVPLLLLLPDIKRGIKGNNKIDSKTKASKEAKSKRQYGFGILRKKNLYYY